MFKRNNPDSKRAPLKKKKRRKVKKSTILILTGIALAIAACGFGIWYFVIREPENQTLTSLDEISLGDLQTMPQAEFNDEDSIEVKDYTIYGTSLVFYDRIFEPMETDGFFGRNVNLRNIETDENVTVTFSGGADAGIDLQNLEKGVYEVYLSDGYRPKRAYMEEPLLAEPYYTMTQDGTTRKVQITASPTYLRKYNIEHDKPYLYISVTDVDELPVYLYDVVIAPSGTSGVNQYGITPSPLSDGFDESTQSWQLALLVKERLENAGLRVMLSREQDTYTTLAGEDSSLGQAYASQAKIFLTLAMDENSNYSQPYVVSSPFTNAKLGDQIAKACMNAGVVMQTISNTSVLEPGSAYDDFEKDENYQYLETSLTDEIRETGGKVTSAGTSAGWEINAAYQDAYGMNGVVFYYASTTNTESHAYYAEHVDGIADGIAQGILNYAHNTNSIQPAQSK